MKIVRPRAVGAQLPLEPDPRLRVEAAHRLVEDQERPVGQERRQQAELLRHALGVAADLPGQGKRIEIELPGEHGGGMAAGLELIERQRQTHEILPGEVAGRLKALRQIGEARPAARCLVRFAEQAHGAAEGRHQHQDRLEQRGLAGAVQADQAEGLARLDGQRDAVQNLRPAVAGAKSPNLDRRRLRQADQRLGPGAGGDDGEAGRRRRSLPSMISPLAIR
jgi:hypothetical protein